MLGVENSRPEEMSLDDWYIVPRRLKISLKVWFLCRLHFLLGNKTKKETQNSEVDMVPPDPHEVQPFPDIDAKETQDMVSMLLQKIILPSIATIRIGIFQMALSFNCTHCTPTNSDVASYLFAI